MRLLMALLGLAVAACGGATPFPSPPPRPTSTLPPSPTRLSASATPAAAGTLAATPTRPTAAPTATPQLVVETGTLAPGFSVTTYGVVPAPASVAFGPDGKLYVASTHGFVYVLADPDADGAAGPAQVFAGDLDMPLGLAWAGRRLYISYRGAVKYVEDTDEDGVSDRGADIVSRLPAWGLHQNDGLALGDDGLLYLGMGSTCDHCAETDARSGTILHFRLDGSEAGVFASGLRNPYDLAFNAAGDLFATDNSRDDLGPDQPPEELNHIRAGRHYGWPECWLGNAAPLCAERTGPVAAFSAHTSANGLVFYHGRQFPAEYFDNAFVAILGSIYMFPDDTERGVKRVRLTPQGGSYVSRQEWFWEVPDGRPVDLTVGPDGGLYVADYAAGMVYRIVYGAP